MKFFFDNCVALAMARGIAEFARAQKIEVAHLTDLFPASTADVEWIQVISRDEWILISGDARISKSPAERAAWRETRLTAFFLVDRWSERSFWTQSQEPVRWFPTIAEYAKSCPGGSGYKLPFQGKEPRLIFTPPDD